jgi:hypothetical protein
LAVCRFRSTEVGTRSIAVISTNLKISPDNPSPGATHEAIEFLS